MTRLVVAAQRGDERVGLRGGQLAVVLAVGAVADDVVVAAGEIGVALVVRQLAEHAVERGLGAVEQRRHRLRDGAGLVQLSGEGAAVAVAAAHDAPVRERVGDGEIEIAVDRSVRGRFIGGPRVAELARLVGDHRAVRGEGALNALRLVELAGEVVAVRGEINGDELHLLRVGRIALVAGEVERHGDAEAHQHGGEHQRADAACAPDAEALVQQHFRGEVAEQAGEEHTGDGAGERVLAVMEVETEDEEVDKLPERERGADRHAVFEDGARPCHGDDGAGRLARAAAVDEQAEHGEHDADGSIDAEHAKAAEHILAAPNDLMRPVAEDAVHAGDIAHVQHADKLPGRREEGEGLRSGITAVAVEEVAGKGAHEVFHTHGKEIEGAVEHGRGQNLPGEHHAQHSEGVEEQHREHGGEQRGTERGKVQRAEAGGGDAREGKGEHERGDHAHKAGEVVGRVQRLTPHRHGMEALRGAGVGKVGEHRHGEEDAEHGAHHKPAVGADLQQGIRGVGHDRDTVIVGQLVEQRQRQEQQPDQDVAQPQRPEALQVLAEKRAVKERCRGLHSRHLPAHR